MSEFESDILGGGGEGEGEGIAMLDDSMVRLSRYLLPYYIQANRAKQHNELSLEESILSSYPDMT